MATLNPYITICKYVSVICKSLFVITDVSPLKEMIASWFASMSQKALRSECGREFGFYGKKVFSKGTIDLGKLADKELENFPKDSLTCERLFT